MSELSGPDLLAAAAIALQRGGPLQPAWLEPRYTRAGRLALGPLPGMPMYERALPADLAALRREHVDCVLCLLEDHEFAKWGVDGLLDAYSRAGFAVQRHPIRDHSIGTDTQMREIVNWLSQRLDAGDTVLVHCVGGLGRSGIVAACYLKAQGLDSAVAIAAVRQARSPYAIETAEQEEFVRAFVPGPAPQSMDSRHAA